MKSKNHFAKASSPGLEYHQNLSILIQAVLTFDLIPGNHLWLSILSIPLLKPDFLLLPKSSSSLETPNSEIPELFLAEASSRLPVENWVEIKAIPSPMHRIIPELILIEVSIDWELGNYGAIRHDITHYSFIIDCIWGEITYNHWKTQFPDL